MTNYRNYIYNILYAFIVLILFSCQKENEISNCVGKYTLIIYIAGDNDLSDDANIDLNQIISSYKKTGARLIVFIDTYDENPKLLEICKSGPILLREYQEFNSVSSDVSVN